MTLTIQDLGALGEFFGSIAVLATLVYLALQTRQNTKAIQAQLDAAMIASSQTIILSGIMSSDLADDLQRDRIDDVTTDQIRLGSYWTSMLVAFQSQLYQFRRGLLPTFNEAQIGATIGGFFTLSRSFSAMWEGYKQYLTPEFVEWVEEQRSKAA